MLVGMQNGMATLEDSLVLSHKTKHSHIMLSSNLTEIENLKVGNWKVESLYPCEHPHIDVYSSFTYNCQKSGSSQDVFG